MPPKSRKQKSAAVRRPSNKSRLSNYYDGDTRLSELQRKQVAKEAELKLLLKLAGKSLKKAIESDDVLKGLAATEEHHPVVARAQADMAADVEEVKNVYTDLMVKLEKLEVGDPIALGLGAKNTQLLSDAVELEAVFEACGPILLRVNNKALLVEVEALRAELQVGRDDVDYATKLLMAACRRTGSVAEALVTNKIQTNGRTDIEKVLEELKLALAEMRLENNELKNKMFDAMAEDTEHQKQLSAAQTEVEKLQEKLKDVYKKTRKEDVLEQKIAKLTGECDRLRQERQSLQNTVNSKKKLDRNVQDVTDYAMAQLKKSGEEYSILEDEKAELEDRLAATETRLKEEAASNRRLAARLEDALSKLEDLSSDHHAISVSMKALEADEANLQVTNREQLRQLNDAEKSKKAAEDNITAMRKAAEEYKDRCEREAAEKVKIMQAQLQASVENARGHGSVAQAWQDLVGLQKKLSEKESETQAGRISELEKVLDEERARATEADARLHKINREKEIQSVAVRHENEALKMSLEAESSSLASMSVELTETKAKVAVLRWIAAARLMQFTKTNGTLQRAIAKIREYKAAYAELKKRYEDLDQEAWQLALM